LAISPNSANALYRLGYVYDDAGNYSEALDVLLRAQQLQPKWLRIMEELGYSYIQLKRYDEAGNVLRQAVSTYKNAELAHYYLGQVYVAKGNRANANTEYRELQRLNSEYASKLMGMINKM
jgi:tetratricopeptide (TPR) repeat protein